MDKALNEVLAALPDDTKIYVCLIFAFTTLDLMAIVFLILPGPN